MQAELEPEALVSVIVFDSTVSVHDLSKGQTVASTVIPGTTPLDQVRVCMCVCVCARVCLCIYVCACAYMFVYVCRYVVISAP
jgi:hypothetical protein